MRHPVGLSIRTKGVTDPAVEDHGGLESEDAFPRALCQAAPEDLSDSQDSLDSSRSISHGRIGLQFNARAPSWFSAGPGPWIHCQRDVLSGGGACLAPHGRER